MNLCRNIRCLIAVMLPLWALTSSCVHEWPVPADTVDVRLRISHDIAWTESNFDYEAAGRAGNGDTWKAHYTFKVFRKGDTSHPEFTFSLERDEVSPTDFETVLPLSEGEWDIFAWRDLVKEGNESFYDCENFNAVTYTLPYRGDTDRRDAFEGSTSVAVPESITQGAYADADMVMKRPAARYIFIATDFSKFYNETVLKSPLFSELPSAAGNTGIPEGYSVVVRYPLFMPAVYNILSGKVTDSWTGMTYEAAIRPLDNGEAAIALDYVFINSQPGGVQVQLALKSPDGTVTPLTPAITVPIARGQTTYARGKFLTAAVGSGIDIDFSFSGDINIEIK